MADTNGPIERIFNVARDLQRIIALPEATDPRTLHAARSATDKQLAKVVLVGSRDDIAAAAKAENVKIDDIEVRDVDASDKTDGYVAQYVENRKKKGMDEDTARKVMADSLFWAAMGVAQQDIDGMVAGAVNSTANVVRSGLHCIGTRPGIKTVSSNFLMIVPDCEFGNRGTFLYADCGVVIDPTEEQLADIAIATADSYRALVGGEPIVAMLSFSTYGSASHPRVDKVTNALKLVRDKAPELKVDGDLQADAALVASVAQRKAPESTVAGKANTLIFPDLDAGNICYKITQRLAKAEAFGPILQGFAAPINDLSRGCDAEDIETMVAITAAQTELRKDA